jgi:hypothetical protein
MTIYQYDGPRPVNRNPPVLVELSAALVSRRSYTSKNATPVTVLVPLAQGPPWKVTETV